MAPLTVDDAAILEWHNKSRKVEVAFEKLNKDDPLVQAAWRSFISFYVAIFGDRGVSDLLAAVYRNEK